MALPRFPLLLLLAAIVAGASEPVPAFHGWAATPPMGWNSWDCFATTVTEEQTKAQAAYMAEHLKAHGPSAEAFTFWAPHPAPDAEATPEPVLDKCA